MHRDNKLIAPQDGFPSYTQDLFGTLQTNSFVKVIETSFNSGIINDQVYTQYTASGGSITADTSYGNFCNVSCSTSVGSYATIRSKRPLIYRAGSVCVARCAAKFPTEASNTDNSLVFIGIGNAQNDLYFCYSNGIFGVRRSINGLLEVRQLEITAASSGVETATITLNDVVYTATLSNAGGDVAFTAHEVEVGDDYSDDWNIEHIGNTIIFIGNAVKSRGGTYSFSSTGTATGSFTQIKAGQSLTTDFIPITNWNGSSVMKDVLNPEKWNMYEIEYVFYGIGNIIFKVFNPGSGVYEPVHKLTFANKSSSLSLSSQNMYFQAGIASLGSSTAMTLSMSGTVAGYLDGAGLTALQGLNPLYNIENSVSITGGQETVILALQDRFVVNGFSNITDLYITRIGVTADGSKPDLVKIILNPTTLSASTTADYTNFQYIDETGSPLIFDKTSLTYTGGTVIQSFVVGINASFNYTLPVPVVIGREDVLIITGTSTTNNTISISIDIAQDGG